MLQELFRLPFINRPIYGYGLMIVLAFLSGMLLMRTLSRRKGFNPEYFTNAALIALISGIAGARLSHVLESIFTGGREYANNGLPFDENFVKMINVSSGGLTFYGGFLFATPVLIWYAIRKKIPVLKGMDIVAPSLMIGLAFGRMGCFLNGCCYGERCDSELGVRFPYGSPAYVEQFEEQAKRGEIVFPRDPRLISHRNGELHLLSIEDIRARGLESLIKNERAFPVHPTELYSVFNALLICGVCLAFYTLSPSPGRVFALMLLLKGLSRFLLEMIRVEPPVFFKLLSYSMMVSILLLISGVVMWICTGRKADSPAATPPQVAPA